MTLAWRMPDIRQIITAAEAQVREPASLEQREAGNYQKGHFTWCGLDITLESAKGMERKGVDRNGKAWSITLKNSYGYIKGTDSAEPGDEMDVFVGDDPEIELIYVVDQNKNDKPEFDEHKCIIGCANSADAKAVYLANYSAGWKGFRSVTALTVPQFKSWLENGDMTKPLKGQRYADFCKEATLSAAFKDDQVRSFFKEREKRDEEQRERASWRMPVIGGLMAAAGYGLNRVGDAALTPDDRKSAEDLMALGAKLRRQRDTNGGLSLRSWLLPPMETHEQFKGTPELFYDYIDRASRASRSKIFGKDVVEWLHTVKPLLGFTEDGPGPNASAAQIEFHKENLDHYPSFQRGPIDAYKHQLRKLVKDPGWDLKWPNHFLRTGTGELTHSDPKGMMKDIESNLDAFLKGYGKDLSHGAQMDVIRRFGGWLEARNPALAKAKNTMETNASRMQADAAGWYSNGTRAALALLQDIPKALGGALMLGGGGVLLHSLLKKLSQPDKVKAPRGYRIVRPAKKSDDENKEKQAGISKLLSAGLRRAAKVPAGQTFAPTVGTGVRRVLKLGFNPELGRTGNIVKRVLQGAGLYGGWRAADGLVSTIGETAGEAARFIPNGGKLEPTNRYLESWRDQPWMTALRTAWKGIPSYVPDAQRELMKHLAVLTAKSKLHGGHMPSMTDVAKKFYSPAVPHTFNGVRSLLGSLVGPPTAEDYGKVLTDAADVYKQPPVQ